MKKQVASMPLSGATPWHRQFWPWFLIALPASVVVAAFVTLFIAIHHADEVVQDDYYKDGLAINQRLEREQLARTLNVRATLTWQPDSGEIRVRMAAPMTSPRLILHWLHPLKRQLDRDIVLTRRDGVRAEDSLYGGQVDAPLYGRFYVQLENMTSDANAAWRLHGEITTTFGTSEAASVTLVP